MVAVWFVKGDLVERDNQRRCSCMIATAGSAVLPDVQMALSEGQKLAVVRSMTLLVDFDAENVEFMSNQTHQPLQGTTFTRKGDVVREDFPSR